MPTSLIAFCFLYFYSPVRSPSKVSQESFGEELLGGRSAGSVPVWVCLPGLQQVQGLGWCGKWSLNPTP